MPDVFENFKEYKGEPQTQEPTAQTTPSESATATTGVDPTPATPPLTETLPAQPQAATQGEPTVDKFIEDFNKRFGTQFKADTEIKPIFELPKKITEYESKLTDYEGLKKSNDQYKVDLENAQRAEARKYLESPLMQRAYVADQLVKKYPNSDVTILTELAMSDVDKLSDLDVLAKDMKMKLPGKNLETIKSVILDEVGIDPTQDPKEWDEKALTKLAFRAASARENIKNLVGGIELPKVETKEETDARIASELSKRTEQAAPHKAEYSKFDKFQIQEGLDYTVPDEFKSKLGDIFDTFLLKAGNEPTKENLDTLNDIRDSLFFNTYKKEIYDVMYKDAESKVKAELDKKLGNAPPLNTATASDGAGNDANKKPGHNDFKADIQGQRVTHFG